MVPRSSYAYEMQVVVEIEILKYLKTVVLREAEIRLFDCKLTVQTNEVRN